jgi:KDO2-lipid IV(A) lauroyltransferase
MRRTIGILFLKFLLFIAQYVPLAVRRYVGEVLGTFFSLFPTTDRTVAQLQLAIFLKNEDPGIVRKMYAHLGRSILESLELAPLFVNINTFFVSHAPELEEAMRRRNKGIVVLASHAGNWDILAAYAVHRGIPVTTIAQVAKRKLFQDLLDMIRTKYGVSVLPRDDPYGAQKIRTLLKKGEIVAALIDQDTKVRNVTLPFFGVPCEVPMGIVQLAQRSEAEIYAVFIGMKDGVYHVFIYKLDQTQSAEAILTRYNELLEAHIRKFPEQWVWVHKRWRTFANQKRFSTAEYIVFLRSVLAHGSWEAALQNWMALRRPHVPGERKLG